MEHPVKDIRGVIRSLCQGTPEEQHDAMNRYYVPSASFVHPFCRVPSFQGLRVPLIGEVDSRMLVLGIYKWYKLLSPKIDIEVESSVFDQRANLLYVTVSQTFSIWFLPFHKSPVRLVTVLTLTSSDPANNSPNRSSTSSTYHDRARSTTSTASTTRLGEGDGEPTFAEVASSSVDTSSAVDGTGQPQNRKTNPHSDSYSRSSDRESERRNPGGNRRYWIKKQHDLYQVNDFVRFVALTPGAMACSALQILGTAACLLGVVFLGPIFSLFLNSMGPSSRPGGNGNTPRNTDKNINGDVNGNGANINGGMTRSNRNL